MNDNKLKYNIKINNSNQNFFDLQLFNSVVNPYTFILDDNYSVNCEIDEDMISTDIENPEQPDGIPDKYQVKVSFNGLGCVTEFTYCYVTLYDENGILSEDGVGYLSKIPEVTISPGYDENSIAWYPFKPNLETEITGSTNFSVTATAAHPSYYYKIKIISISKTVPYGPDIIENGVDLDYKYELETNNPIVTSLINQGKVKPNFEGKLYVGGTMPGYYPIKLGTLKPIDGENFIASDWEVEYDGGTLTITASPEPII